MTLLTFLIGEGSGLGGVRGSCTCSSVLVSGEGGNSLAGVGKEDLFPYFRSYPPKATFRTCTTLTPVFRAMSALLELGLDNKELICSYNSWFIEMVFLLPVGEESKIRSLIFGVANSARA